MGKILFIDIRDVEGFLKTNCDLFNIVPKIPPLEHKAVVWTDSGEPDLVFTYLRYANVIEIYNVCTERPEAFKEALKVALAEFVSLAPNIPIWIGINIDNPIVDDLRTLYTQNQFLEDGSVTSVSPAGNTFPTKFLNLYRKTCDTTIHLPVAVCQHIKDKYMEENTEYGGNLTIGPDKTLDIESTHKGQPGIFTVDIPNPGILLWHTHPATMYKIYGLYVGFPSTIDMTNIFRAYDHYGGRCSIVFTVEGVYVIQPHQSIVRAFNRNDICRDDTESIIQIIGEYLVSPEQARVVTWKVQTLKDLFQPEAQHRILSEYIPLVNNMRLDLVLEWAVGLQYPSISIGNTILRLYNKYRHLKTFVYTLELYSWDACLAEGISFNLSYPLQDHHHSCPAS
jgi:hypothetical protein